MRPRSPCPVQRFDLVPAYVVVGSKLIFERRSPWLRINWSPSISPLFRPSDLDRQSLSGPAAVGEVDDDKTGRQSDDDPALNGSGSPFHG
jgi:hypothetical protein